MPDVGVMDRIAGRIRRGKSFLVSTHVRLDGDGAGSALAVAALVRSLGKKVLLLTHGPVPRVFRFLPGAETAVNIEDDPGVRLPDDLDTLFVVDVADSVRLGDVLKHVPQDLFTISIDHHATGDLDADLDYCDVSASSTGELVYLLCRRGHFDITPQIATCIYTAVLSDTQRFSLPNTTPGSLRVAAEMVEKGADPGLIGDRVYRSQTPGQLGLWAEVARRVEIDPDARLAWSSLSEEMLVEHDVHADDTQDLTDVTRMLVGVEVGVLFREMKGGRGVRVSLRSNHVPVLAVAEKFGGGGHELACGCELEGTLNEVRPKVLAALRALLAKTRGA